MGLTGFDVGLKIVLMTSEASEAHLNKRSKCINAEDNFFGGLFGSNAEAPVALAA
jgi:hypothetical protein